MKPNHVSMARARLFGMGTAVALLMVGQAAYADATPVCVTSDAELVSALSLAQSTAVTIQLMQDTYHLNQTVWNAKLTPATRGKFRDGSSLLGGYTNVTCSGRNIGVNNTIVTDTTSVPDDAFNILGDATIEGITFKLANGLIIGADSTANNPLPNKSKLTVRRNVFTESTGVMKQPLEIDWNEPVSVDGTVRFVDNLVHDNSGGGGSANSAAIFVEVIGGKPTIELVNNTIVNNGGSLGGFGLLNLSNVPVFADNNIFFGNSSSDFAVFFGTQNTLVDNVMGTHDYVGTVSASGTTTANPKLDSNFRPIESPISNVINTGTANVTGGLPATDLSGRARQIGSVPDRGAFESTINDAIIQSVTSAADSGVGTLRAAITSANGNPAGTLILFNLGQNCPYTINLQSQLPNITAPMAIAGYSQDGSSQNDSPEGFNATICVVLKAAVANISDGLFVPPGISDSLQLQVSGLAFSGFTHAAVSMYSGSAHTVTGIHIGGNSNGVVLDPVGNGIIIGPGVHDVKIGDGDTFSEFGGRNIIGSAISRGIVLDGVTGISVPAHDNKITNNLIGVGWNIAGSGNFTNRGNGGAGVVIAGYNNQMYGNVIEYNGGYGIDLTSTGANNNYILDNKIGYLDSYTNQGNGNHGGILIENGAHDNDLVSNSIWFNIGTGIRVLNGQGNSFSGNQLFSNDGLGIDLAAEGVTANDNDTDPQAVDYANRGLNFPVLTQAIGGHTIGTVSGTFTSAPGYYYIRLFRSSSCDPSGYGEAEFGFDSTAVSLTTAGPDGQATGSFSVTNLYPTNLPAVPYMTAIAIDSAGNTSEISQCILYTDDTIFADGFDN